MKLYRQYNRGKGIALIIILVLITAIVVVGLGFIIRGDTELLCGQNMELKADMDYLAESGLEHARGLILNPQDVSEEEEHWWHATEQQLNSDSNDYYDVTVDVCEPNWLNWRITSLAYRQAGGSSVAQSSLTAQMRLDDPAIGFWSGTAVTLYPGMSITGDVYGVLPGSGSINGDRFTVSPVNEPNINYGLLTSNFSIQSITSPLSDTTLGGSTEVFYRSGDLEIGSNVIINGCLAVDGNLIVTGVSNVITAKKNVPAIYVSGNLIIGKDAALDCNGLVFVDGRIETSIYNAFTSITGSLFTDDGIRYILPDYSGNGYDGIVNGDCNWVDGKVDGAINFDGDGDFIDIGNHELDITESGLITVAAWIKVDSFSNSSAAIITKGNTSWRLQRWANTNFMEFACSGLSGVGGDSVHGNIDVNDGQWHHVAGIYDGSRLYLYVDGQEDNNCPANGSISSNSASIYIGGNSEVSGRWFNGIIDEVLIYNCTFAPSTIGQLYSGGTIEDPMGYWKMDWGSAITVNAAPTKAAIYHWPGGSKDRWSPAAGAFYKSIKRIEN